MGIDPTTTWLVNKHSTIKPNWSLVFPWLQVEKKDSSAIPNFGVFAVNHWLDLLCFVVVVEFAKEVLSKTSLSLQNAS